MPVTPFACVSACRQSDYTPAMNRIALLMCLPDHTNAPMAWQFCFIRLRTLQSLQHMHGPKLKSSSGLVPCKLDLDSAHLHLQCQSTVPFSVFGLLAACLIHSILGSKVHCGMLCTFMLVCIGCIFRSQLSRIGLEMVASGHNLLWLSLCCVQGREH